MYINTAQYAREHGELDQYRHTHWDIVGVRNCIEDILAVNFDGMHLDRKTMDDIKDLDSEMLKVVIVCTIRNKAWDGRISHTNKAWAQAQDLPDCFVLRMNEYSITTHPTVFNGFVDMYRRG